jgi:integrase/recombinase XerD
MSIRKHPTKGDGWWQLDVGYGDNRQRPAFEGTREEAQEVHDELKKLIRPPSAHSTNPRLHEIVPDFLAAYKHDHLQKGYERTIYSIEHIQRHLGKYCLMSISHALVDRYKGSRIEEGVTPSTINKELCALSMLLKWAVEQGRIDEALRVKKFPSKMTKAPLPVVPSVADVVKILAQAHPRRRLPLQLMAFCGLRMSEALRLTKEDVLESRQAIIVRGKGNKQRVVPVPSQEIWGEVLKRTESVSDGFLFLNKATGRPYRDLRGTLKEAAKRAGFDARIYHHLLRHWFGAVSTELGIPTRATQIIMGHESIKTTEIYSHVTASHLAAEMGKWKSVTNDVNKNTRKTKRGKGPRH